MVIVNLVNVSTDYGKNIALARHRKYQKQCEILKNLHLSGVKLQHVQQKWDKDGFCSI